MEIPDDIPERAWEKADNAVWGDDAIANNISGFAHGLTVVVARAILAAVDEERTRSARFASAGMIREGRDAWAKGYRCAAADIYEAIRNNKDQTP